MSQLLEEMNTEIKEFYQDQEIRKEKGKQEGAVVRNDSFTDQSKVKSVSFHADDIDDVINVGGSAGQRVIMSKPNFDKLAHSKSISSEKTMENTLYSKNRLNVLDNIDEQDSEQNEVLNTFVSNAKEFQKRDHSDDSEHNKSFEDEDDSKNDSD